MPQSQQWRASSTLGILTIVLTLVGWASIPLFLRHFSESIDAWTSNGWRYGFSALIWAPVLIIAACRKKLAPGVWRAAIVPSLFNSAGQVCFTSAHYCIDPGLLTFGLRIQMVFIAIGAYLLFPAERRIILTPQYLIGLVALMTGTSLALFSHGAAVSAEHAMGVALALVSGALFAGYGLAVRKCMRDMNPVIAFAAISQYTAGAMIILMLVLGDRCGLSALDMNGQQIGLLLISSVIGIAMGHVLYYISIARLGVAVSVGVLQLQPFLVAVASLILFDELLSWRQWTGGALAVSGAMLMLYIQQRISRIEHITEDPVAIAEGESGS